VATAAFFLPCRRFAQKLSNQKSIQINGLHEYFGFVTGALRGCASSGALVDFQCRASRGFSHD
jgi:hypothetical protein